MNNLILIVALVVNGSVSAQTWKADNGDGTFTNPLFYDEFSDPDLIRVGEDYYLTGTTMLSFAKTSSAFGLNYLGIPDITC